MLSVEKLNDIEKKQMKDFIIEQGFENRKKSGTWKKGVAVAVAVIIIGIPIFGATFPALAQNIPIIGGFFGRIIVNQAISQEGFDVTVHRVTFSPTRTIVDFSYVSPFSDFGMHLERLPRNEYTNLVELDDLFEITVTQIRWEMVDNFGNEVIFIYGDGVSTRNGFDFSGRWFFELTYQEVTQIIITPIAYIWDIEIWHDPYERERVRAEGTVIHPDGGISMQWEATYQHETHELVERIVLEPIIIDLSQH